MPKRTDISTILIIGAGPIVIGQACEFDYSGTQACKALKEEGYRIVLVNSNPATIMTDPELADATYIEPITPEIVAKIIEKERPRRLCAAADHGRPDRAELRAVAAQEGTLEKFDVEMIGATADAIDKAEDRERFREAMTKIGSKRRARAPDQNAAPGAAAMRKRYQTIGLPAIIRPSFTMGGTGGGIAYNREEFSTSSSAASMPRRPTKC
jgi:carbamoyl-phosphate synthase large subunit